MSLAGSGVEPSHKRRTQPVRRRGRGCAQECGLTRRGHGEHQSPTRADAPGRAGAGRDVRTLRHARRRRRSSIVRDGGIGGGAGALGRWPGAVARAPRDLARDRRRPGVANMQTGRRGYVRGEARASEYTLHSVRGLSSQLPHSASISALLLSTRRCTPAPSLHPLSSTSWRLTTHPRRPTPTPTTTTKTITAHHGS